MASPQWNDKPWVMIVAEVEVLDLDELELEAWDWFALETFLTEDHRAFAEEDIAGAIAMLGKPSTTAWSLVRLRGWCCEKRHDHQGRSPDELE